MADNPFSFSPTSPLTPFRKDRIKQNVIRSLERQRETNAARAAARAGQARQVSPDQITRQRRAVEGTAFSQAPRTQGVMDEGLLTELERRVQEKRDRQFFIENPRTADWALANDDIFATHDELETIGFFESAGRAISKRTDAIIDNVDADLAIYGARDMQRLLQDRVRTLEEIQEDQAVTQGTTPRTPEQVSVDQGPLRDRKAELEQQVVDFTQQGRLEEAEKARQRADAIGAVLTPEGEGAEPSFVQELSSDAQGLYRFLQSRINIPVPPDEEDRQADIETFRTAQEDILLDRSFEARERELLWPTPRWRREIEQALQSEEGEGPMEALGRLTTVATDNPTRFAQFLLEIGAESGIGIVAAGATMAATRNPRLAATVGGLTSFETARGLAFDEFVQSAGHDISTREGVQRLLSDPGLYDRLRDKTFRYGAVIGIFDGLSMNIAGRALSSSPAGNMLLQTMAQGTAGGLGELFGRMAAGEEIVWTEVFLEALAEVVTTPVEVGAMAGGALKTKVRQVREVNERRKLFDILSGKLSTSKLRSRDAATFERAVTEVTKNGPVESVYVDPARVEEMFQGPDAPMTLEEFFEATPELDIRAFNEARDSGSDFVIPMGTFAARIAGTPVDQMISPHMRLKPDDMSAADADTFMNDLQRTREELQAGTDRVATSVGELRGQIGTEFERLQSELTQAGRAPAIAEREASLLVRAAQVGAERAGISIDEYVERYSLPTIRNVDTVGPAPARPLLDPDLALELITSTDPSVNDIPDVAAIRELLDEQGLEPANVNRADILTAARELASRGELRGELPVEERALPTAPDQTGRNEEVFDQTATLRIGEEDPRDWGIDPEQSNKVRDVALKLQARQRKKYGKINRKTRGPKTIEKMANWMADEIEMELQSPGGPAVGWYTTKFQAALDAMADQFPEFLGDNIPTSLIGLRQVGVTTSEEARSIMTAIVAVTSNGTKIVENFRNAARVYDNFRKTGRMTLGDVKMGDRTKHTETVLVRYGQILLEMGNAIDAREFLISETTVSEVNKRLRQMDQPAMGSMPADMRVPLASSIFGPKLGAFYANLSGSTGYLTMDLWWTRTINRYRGDVLPRVVGLKGDEFRKQGGKLIPQGLARFKVLIGRPDLSDKQALNYATEYAERYRLKGFKEGTEAEKAANTVYKAAFAQLAEQPEGAADRRFMVNVAVAAQAEIERRTGERYSIADIQAMIWYYEKRLYADMGVRDSGDISYQEAAARAVQLEQQADEFFQTDQPSDIRDDVVSGTELAGDGRGFTSFFGDVTSGVRQQANLADYTPVIELPQDVLAFTEKRERFGGNFDDHIKASIPGYSEMQDAVGYALAQVLGDGALLRIGGSEGSTVKAMIEMAGPNATGVSMDPNVQMQASFEEAPQAENVVFDLSAFSDAESEGVTLWTEDDGTEIKGFDPQGQTFDVVVEQMVFQFIDKGRAAQIARVKELMAEGGLFYTAEKFGGPAEQFNANEAKKDEFKAQFFSQEELAAKRAEVLQTGEDAVEGMTDLQVSQAEMERVLTTNFEHVVQVWDSGNFKGYIASDDRAKIDFFLEQLPPLGSRFSTVETPRVVGGLSSDDTFFQSDLPAQPSDFDAANLTEDTFKKDGWFVVSAAQESLGPATSPDNRARANQLRDVLEERGYDFIEMNGVYKGSPDGKSFLVFGGRDLGEALGAEWGQESILTKDGLIFTDGSGSDPVPFDGVVFGDAAEKEDFFSVPLGRDSNGERRPAFSLNLQFPEPPDTSIDGTGGKSHYGAELVNGQMLLTHWSDAPRDVLDPTQAGSGPLRGPERKRGGPKKVFFGLHIGKPYGYSREYGIGQHRHEVRVDPRTMYPWFEDPDGLKEKIDRTKHKSSIQAVNRYEELIKEAGYKGYFAVGGGDKNLTPLGDAAVLFDAVKPDRVTLDNDASWARSQAFNDWFGESVVTNNDGSPRMVYHGTRQGGFRIFDPEGRGKAQGTGAFFTRDLQNAVTYSGTLDEVVFPPTEDEFIAAPIGSSFPGAGTLTSFEMVEGQDPEDINDPRTDIEFEWETDTGVGGIVAHVNREEALFVLYEELAADESQSGVVPVYLRMVDPLILDADGANWDTVPFGEEFVVLDEDGDTVDFAADEEEAAQLAAEVPGGSFEKRTETRTTDDIVRDARLMDVDGVIFRDIVDEGPEGRGFSGPTDVYVVFNSNQIKSSQNRGQWDPNNDDILAQKRESRNSAPRGSIVLPKDLSGQATIQLFETANLSTVLHETGHFFLWNLQRQSQDGLEFAVEQYAEVKAWWRRNAEAIATEAGVDAAQVEEFIELGTTGDGQVDKAVHRTLHEQFARGFEAYAFEGKSPSNTMRSLFESFAAWLTSVYQNLRGLNVTIDADLRAVFDRMLATDEEIAGVMDRDAIDSQIARTAREMGLDEDSYRRLTILSEEARDEGKQLARKELLRVERQMRSAEYKARLAEIDREETEAVNGERHNRVIQWLAYGRWLGVEDAPDGLPLELRLDTDLLVEQYDDQYDDILKQLPRGRRPMHVQGSGLSADEVAGWFGYGSGAEMLKAVIEAPKARDEIKARVKSRVAEEVEDPMGDPGELEEVVADAMHGEKRGQVIVAELRAINRLGGKNKKVTTRAVAKQIAQDLIQKMPVREALQTNRYQSAERRHAEDASRLLAEGRVDEAFEAKRKQLVQHQLYIESRKTAEMVGKAERLAGRLKRAGTRQNLAGEYLGAIDDILETYDFRKVSGKAEVRRERLRAYIDAMKAAGRESEMAIPDHVINNAKRVPYKTLSVQRLQGVFDSLKNIEHMARRKQKLIDAQDARDRQEIIDEVRDAFRENIKGKPFNRIETRGEKTASGIKGYFNLVRNADTILRKIDGWRNRGAAARHFKDRIDRAGVVAMQMREQATEDLDALFEAYTPGERRRMATRQVWDGHSEAFSKWDLISIALNTGNKDNYERLTSRDSRGAFRDEQVKALLSHLDERDWRFVQSIWDYLDSTYWPQIAEREERTTGVAPTKVEGRMMVEVGSMPRSGIRGGYYPIVYDRRASANVREDQNLDLMQNMMAGRFGKAQTKNGHTKERAAGGGGRTIQLGMQVLFGHVNNVVHDLAFGEAVNTTWSLLREPEVRAEFENAGMLPDYEALEVWVQDVAAGPASGTHVLASTMRRLKSGFTLSKLAFNMSTVAIQVTGATQSISVIGAGNFMKGLQTYLLSARGRYRLAQDVKDRSPFMRERETSFQRDVFDLINSTQFDPLRGVSSEVMRTIMKAGFYAMQKVQYYVIDMPTWLGAHHQGLGQGMSEEEAAAHADRMVARAQASGLYADRSAVERGTLGGTQRQNEFLRLFTALGSYMFAKFNVAEEVVGRTRRDISDPDANTAFAILKGATDMVLLFTVEAILYNLIKGELPGQGEDDEDDDTWATFLLKETALSVASVFPFVRDVSSAVQGFGGGGAYGGVSETFGRALSSAGDVALGEATAADARALVDLSGLMVPGVPSTAIWRVIDGSGATGEEPSVLSMIMGR